MFLISHEIFKDFFEFRCFKLPESSKLFVTEFNKKLSAFGNEQRIFRKIMEYITNINVSYSGLMGECILQTTESFFWKDIRPVRAEGERGDGPVCAKQPKSNQRLEWQS